MTRSNVRKLSVIALSISMAFVMLIGTVSAKDGQPKAKKGGARAKKAGDQARRNRRKGSGQAARIKAVKDLVDDLAIQLNLTEAQKVRAEQIVKKHMRTITARRGKGPGQDKPDAPDGDKKPKGKGKGRGKRGGGKNKNKE